MHKQITVEQIERKITHYSCDQEGCEFKTTDSLESDRHYGETHAVKRIEHVSGELMLRFDSKEDFDAYRKAHGIGERFAHWDEPGWYRSYNTDEPCPRGCCYDECGHLDPASWIGFKWQEKIKKYQGRLKELAEFLGEDGTSFNQTEI